MTLERLKELAGKATPGPWEVYRTDVGATVVADDGGMCPYSEGWKAETLEANAQLIVLSRNHIDALIAIAEAAKKVDASITATRNASRYSVSRSKADVLAAALAALEVGA